LRVLDGKSLEEVLGVNETPAEYGDGEGDIDLCLQHPPKNSRQPGILAALAPHIGQSVLNATPLSSLGLRRLGHLLFQGFDVGAHFPNVGTWERNCSIAPGNSAWIAERAGFRRYDFVDNAQHFQVIPTKVGIQMFFFGVRHFVLNSDSMIP